MSEPLTPADCDLQDFPFMPLQVARLRDSDLAARAHPEALWYAVMLWSASWHQLPAASLPDDEVVLAKLCGLGRDLKTFRKHRAEAMHGFVRCSDGRLYHGVVAEQARTAWESKLQQRWRSECARIKKANQRNGLDQKAPTYEEFLAGMSPEIPAPCPDIVPGDSADCPSGHLIQGTGTGTGKPRKGAKAPPSDGLFAKAWETFPEWGRRRSSRPKAATAWAKVVGEAGGEEALFAAVRRYAADPDTQREEGRFVPGFDRWLRDGKWEHHRADLFGGEIAETDALPERVQRSWAADWRDKGPNGWKRWERGPCPGEPGCRVSPAIIAEFTRERISA